MRWDRAAGGWVIVVTALIVLTVMPMVSESGPPDPSPNPGGFSWQNVTWDIHNGQSLTYENQTIFLAANLTIEYNATLALKNVTFVMNCSFAYEFNITVNGILNVTDGDWNPATKDDCSNITAPNSAVPYGIAASNNSTITVSNSDITWWGAPASGEPAFNSNGARFANTTFFACAPGETISDVVNTTFDTCSLVDSNITTNNSRGTRLANCALANSSFFLNNSLNTSIAGCSGDFTSSITVFGKNNTVYSAGGNLSMNFKGDDGVFTVSSMAGMRLRGQNQTVENVAFRDGAGLIVEGTESIAVALRDSTASNCTSGFTFISCAVVAERLAARECPTGYNIAGTGAGRLVNSTADLCANGLDSTSAGSFTVQDCTFSNISGNGTRALFSAEFLRLDGCAFSNVATTLYQASINPVEVSNSTFGWDCAQQLVVNSTGALYSVNNSLDRDKCHVFAPSGKLYVQWFLHVRANASNGSPVPFASVRVRDNENGTADTTQATDANGWARYVRATEYDETVAGNRTLLTPHNITVNATGYEDKWVSAYANETQDILVTLGDIEPPSIYPVAQGPVQMGGDTWLRARILDNHQVSNGTMRYMRDGDMDWTIAPMALETGTYQDGTWSAILPAQRAVVNVTYWFYASDLDGNGNRTANITLQVLDTKPPELNYTVIQFIEYNESTRFNISAIDDSPISNISLVYRDMSGVWHNESFTPGMGHNWTYVLPAFWRMGYIQYRFWAVDALGNMNQTQLFDATVDDFTRPKVMDAQPRGSNVSVESNTTIFVKFSEPMNTTSVDAAIRFFQANYTFTTAWSENDTKVVITMSQGIENDSYYYIVIDKTARDKNTLPMQYDYSWFFYTAAPAPPPKPWWEVYWWVLAAVIAAIAVAPIIYWGLGKVPPRKGKPKESAPKEWKEPEEESGK
ncbi:MAG: Ig-like domain-containing protein [Euryarchaeota archaeon]|nr:Ig-like domain-containing protein [Euryarchaeota archaeon]